MAKLVEILARELREWPGVRAISQGAQCFLRDEANYPMEIQLELASDWSTAIVTRAEWQAAVDALKADDCTHSYGSEDGCPECGATKPYSALSDQKISRVTRSAEWDGLGLPPVGIEVEALLPALGNSRYWQAAKVVHGPLRESPFEILVFSLENTKPSWTDEFRPVRTPEQIAAEERSLAVSEIINLIGWTHTVEADIAASRLYDAGYRKQEPK